MNMKWWAMATFSLLGACGPHYTLPNFETNEMRVVSSGRSPQGCIEN